MEELEQVKLNEGKLSAALKEKMDEFENLSQTLEDTRTELKNKVKTLHWTIKTTTKYYTLLQLQLLKQMPTLLCQCVGAKVLSTLLHSTILLL